MTQDGIRQHCVRFLLMHDICLVDTCEPHTTTSHHTDEACGEGHACSNSSFATVLYVGSTGNAIFAAEASLREKEEKPLAPSPRQRLSPSSVWSILVLWATISDTLLGTLTMPWQYRGLSYGLAAQNPDSKEEGERVSSTENRAEQH